MPYSSPEDKRKYQREWLSSRRSSWLQTHGPCKICGSWIKLEVDHVDPTKKISHRVWGWTESRRIAELAKCQVLCEICHLEKTRLALFKFHKFPDHGTRQRYEQRCRCRACLAANAAYRRDVVAKTGKGSTFYRHRREKNIPL